MDKLAKLKLTALNIFINEYTMCQDDANMLIDMYEDAGFSYEEMHKIGIPRDVIENYNDMFADKDIDEEIADNEYVYVGMSNEMISHLLQVRMFISAKRANEYIKARENELKEFREKGKSEGL